MLGFYFLAEESEILFWFFIEGIKIQIKRSVLNARNL